MSLSIECEKRIIVSFEEYKKLFDFFIKEKDATIIKQTNHYFDTKSFALRNAHATLRIREIENGSSEVTLKTRDNIGDLETTETLTHTIEEYNNVVFPVSIQKKIKEITEENVIYFGYLKTKRLEIKVGDYLIALDENHYLEKIDFNLEVEGKTLEDADSMMSSLCDKFKLNKKSCPGKARRFFLALTLD